MYRDHLQLFLTRRARERARVRARFFRFSRKSKNRARTRARSRARELCVLLHINNIVVETIECGSMTDADDRTIR